MTTGDQEDRADYEEEEEDIATDSQALRELRALFDLYDVDCSGTRDIQICLLHVRAF